jgi:uncharacterized membrane protein YfcA
MENSGFLKLGNNDFFKALLMGIGAIVLSVGGDAVLQAVINGGYSFDAIHWKEILASVAVAILTYLKKQFITNGDGDLLKKDEAKLNG